MERRIAQIVSRVFDIYTIAPLCIFVLSIKLLQLHTSLDVVIKWDIVFLTFYFLIPVFGLLILLDMHKIADWDITSRTQRIPVEIFGMFMFLLLFVLTMLFNAPGLYKAFAFINYIIIFCMLEITEYWKISMHASLITTLAVLVIVLFGIYGIFLLLLIPIVYWARIVLAKHSMNQLLVGSTVAALSTFIILKIFNF